MTPTKEQLADVMSAILDMDVLPEILPVERLWYTLEPGERQPWGDRIFFPPEPYDDGGGAAIAAYRYGECV